MIERWGTEPAHTRKRSTHKHLPCHIDLAMVTQVQSIGPKRRTGIGVMGPPKPRKLCKFRRDYLPSGRARGWLTHGAR